MRSPSLVTVHSNHKKKAKRYNNTVRRNLPFKAPRLAEKRRDADDSATFGVHHHHLLLGAVFEREKSARRKQQRRVDEENVAGDD